MATSNLTLRFLLELAGIGAVAYAGFQVPGSWLIRAAAGIGAPLALIVVWGQVVAPNTANGLSQGQKDVIGTLLLLAAAAVLGLAGQRRLAIGFGVVVLANAVLLFVFGQDARGNFGETVR
ncbi:MAG: YrdB family protein [Candidatus Limnocylindria bacterium]